MKKQEKFRIEQRGRYWVIVDRGGDIVGNAKTHEAAKMLVRQLRATGR